MASNRNQKKVLVVTLFSGENEYEECCQSVMKQKYVDIEHVKIENLPNQEAHQKLYELFNRRRNEFDFMAKLDADMALVYQDSLASLLEKFNDEISTLSVTVHDHLTNRDMQSFNIFRNDCFFHFKTNDPLFTDKLKVQRAGKQLSIVDERRNVIHAFNPSTFQAFMFGVHRAMKVTQSENKIPRINNSYYQQKILHEVFVNYQRVGLSAAWYAVVGASEVLYKNIDFGRIFFKNDFEHHFLKLDIGPDYTPHPSMKSNGFYALLRILGPKRFALSLLYYVGRRLKHLFGNLCK